MEDMLPEKRIGEQHMSTVLEIVEDEYKKFLKWSATSRADWRLSTAIPEGIDAVEGRVFPLFWAAVSPAKRDTILDDKESTPGIYTVPGVLGMPKRTVHQRLSADRKTLSHEIQNPITEIAESLKKWVRATGFSPEVSSTSHDWGLMVEKTSELCHLMGVSNPTFSFQRQVHLNICIFYQLTSVGKSLFEKCITKLKRPIIAHPPQTESAQAKSAIVYPKGLMPRLRTPRGESRLLRVRRGVPRVNKCVHAYSFLDLVEPVVMCMTPVLSRMVGRVSSVALEVTPSTRCLSARTRRITTREI